MLDPILSQYQQAKVSSVLKHSHGLLVMFIILQNHFYPEVIAIKYHNFAFIIKTSTNLHLLCTSALASNALTAVYAFLQVFENVPLL
jgi:hypothetical protein